MASKRQETGRPRGLADRGSGRAQRRALALVVAATAVLGSVALLPAGALGSSGGVSVGEDGGTGATSELRVRKSNVKPGKVYFAGKRRAKLSFALKGSDPADIEIRLYHVDSDTSVRAWQLAGVKPGKSQSLTWRGKQASGELGRNGEHEFRIFDAEGLAADTKGAKGNPRFGFYRHKFPLRGSHSYGDGLGAGRGHRGQDLFASCGRRIVAARAGRVQW
ncbi:MAG: hypothetical protein ACR2N5_05655, partial [Solirubrobacterales bacterium]